GHCCSPLFFSSSPSLPSPLHWDSARFMSLFFVCSRGNAGRLTSVLNVLSVDRTVTHSRCLAGSNRSKCIGRRNIFWAGSPATPLSSRKCLIGCRLSPTALVIL